jgi:hypothetical protein
MPIKGFEIGSIYIYYSSPTLGVSELRTPPSHPLLSAVQAFPSTFTEYIPIGYGPWPPIANLTLRERPEIKTSIKNLESLTQPLSHIGDVVVRHRFHNVGKIDAYDKR